ncbi:MAG: glycosyltransferase family 39 protein [Candidatus Fermentibacteraceae bacterium]|nr:glycosyltransferase family 39 protein [Candidatus Fermentibacteraceae bacterium]MBN2609213.1 glycosyltransferase family 39 protein [Candidatus Fermentibacteraceae bacterium]
MGRKTCLVSGLLLAAFFAVYRMAGLLPLGPMDKAVQLLLLLPAAVLIGVWASRKFSFDLAGTLLRRIEGIPSRHFMGTLLCVLAVFSVWMVYGPFEGIPKGGDEVAYFFQSKIYAAGEMSAPVPGVSDPSAHFPFRHFVFDQGRWFIVYTPFHSLLMAPFTAAGAAPMLGPLEGLLSFLGLYLLIRLWAGELMARVSALLLLSSPFFLFMTTTFMAHNTNLMLVTWSLYLISMRVKGGGAGFSLGGGLLMGLAFSTKPYPVLVWLAFVPIAVIVGCRKRWFAILAPAALAAALPFALFLVTNHYYTGSPFKAGYDMIRGGKLIGFGPDKAWFPEYGDYAHTPVRGLMNLARQAGVGSTILFGWPFLSLVPMLLSVRAVRRDRRILWLYLPICLMMVLMWLHYCPAIDYGPRHYYTFLPVIILLSALGLREALGFAGERKGISGRNQVTVTVLGLFLVNLLVYIPEGINLRSGPWQTIDRIPEEMARDYVTEPAVVFMQAGQHGYPNICSGLNFDSPFLDGPVIYCAHQTTGEDVEFMESLDERNPYLYWFDGESFHIEEWTPGLSEEIAPTRSMEYHTYLHQPDPEEPIQ